MDEHPGERNPDELWVPDGWDEEGHAEERSPIDTASLLLGAIAHAVQRAGPETTEHLVKAGHEVLLAVRAFVRHFAEAVTEGSDPAPGGVERIEIAGGPAAARPEAVSLTEPGRSADGDVVSEPARGEPKTSKRRRSTGEP